MKFLILNCFWRVLKLFKELLEFSVSLIFSKLVHDDFIKKLFPRTDNDREPVNEIWENVDENLELVDETRKQKNLPKKKSLKILWGSNNGTSKRLAKILESMLLDTQRIYSNYTISMHHICDYDPEDEIIKDAEEGSCLIIFMPTYPKGSPPDDAEWFCKWLREASNDYRFSKGSLHKLNFSIFGIGDYSYGRNNYCLLARKMEDWFLKLSAHRIYSTCLLDASGASSLESQLNMAADLFAMSLDSLNEDPQPQFVVPNNIESDNEDSAYSDNEVYENNPVVNNNVVDIEDIVKPNPKPTPALDGKAQQKPDMITPSLRKELTKQGYKLVGTHSGVKLCRWTKSMMRGRGKLETNVVFFFNLLFSSGGCYKNSFYGINSHQCMEATPSLACANKCVFCWRHHTNPVGTEWKWNKDKANEIFDGIVEAHYGMIKEFKGVPGVQENRFKEAMTVRHCALSLVGEPIMYPEINQFIKRLHSQQISTFLVTNAQFPDAIETLDPVTQLYVSVDASTKSSLKKIDRPLFKDFWERFIGSLNALGKKGQRTVYRLTLVKSFNSDDIEGYAKLILLGNPDFIEVKGVTFCGSSELTMKNVPWHEEVVKFGKALLEKVNQLSLQQKLNLEGGDSLNNETLARYGLACEHEHSNCILLAHEKFFINKQWHTWIDYDKFNQLVSKFYETGGQAVFGSLDYVLPTPGWAVYGSQEQGFNPDDLRFRKNSKLICKE